MEHTEDTGSNGESEPLELEDGDVLRFPPAIHPDSRGGPPMTFVGEIEIATGSRGEALARAQAEVFYEIALYQAQKLADAQSQAATSDRRAEPDHSGNARPSN